MEDAVLRRAISENLARQLAVMPAVVLTGARQTGKTTIARDLSGSERRFVTLDSAADLDLAERDPDTLIGALAEPPLTIDEVQRAPDLLLAVKRAIDSKRQRGQFLLTGSANLLLMRRVSESLAGRAGYLTLWPMTRREQLGQGREGIWDALLETREREWPELIRSQPDEQEDWRVSARRGGYPAPALELRTDDERAVWFEGYIRTYLERDLQDISAISALPDFRRLMRIAALRAGQITNQSGMARDADLSQPTAHRYLNMLETSYLTVRVPPYVTNRTKRLIKSPKLYWGDTGLAMYIAQENEPRGARLENMVLHDLLVWRDSRFKHAEVFYWRTAGGQEVDFVIEEGERLLPIEVKASRRANVRDAMHIHAFQEEYGPMARPGLVLHTGEIVEWLLPGVLAAPWWRVF
ncbi:MAG: ATP-binding protein [Chloroflexota bacterium]|nr:ATP-binding protein [Chloroflexota bacterium]MDE2884449.1 ATP-binding protein [Chloroflexota bacterium]